MSQATNYQIATGQSGTAYRGQDNDRIMAILTQHSGSTRPAYIHTGMVWLDTTSTTSALLKLYDGASDITIGSFNFTTHALSLAGGTLLAANNLSDVTATTARSNLGLGTAATANTGVGSGNVALVNQAQASVASGSTVDLGAQTSTNVSITGTTTITSLGSTAPAGVLYTVTFAGVLTLTYNATSLILPGAANITTAAGDAAQFMSLGSGNWKCIDYQAASGKAVVSGASGSMTLVSSTTISGGPSTVDLTGFVSGYDYLIEFNGVYENGDNGFLALRFGTGSTTWQTTNHYWAFVQAPFADTSGVPVMQSNAVATTNSMARPGPVNISAAADGCCGQIYIYNPSAGYVKYSSQVVVGNTNGSDYTGAGCYNSATAVTGIRLLWSGAGTFSGGIVRLYQISLTS